MIVHANFAKGYRGGERQTQLLIEQLSQRDLKQRLIVRKESLLGQRCQAIKNLDIIEIKKPYVFYLRHVKGGSVLHAHETKAAQFAFFAHLFFKTPYIITRRVDNPVSGNWLNKKMYEKAQPSVALSRAIKEEILKISPDAEIEIIPSAYTNFTVDDTKVAAIKNRFKDKFLVGHIGALVDIHKGQSYLIEAAKNLEKRFPNMHFILLGQGEDEARFKEQAKDLKNITFEGFVDNVGDYISCFDLFVFPSQNEGLGSILFDVMLLDVPIIASKVGGIVDIIEHDSNGVLIPIRDAKAIENAIEALYNNADKAKQLAAQARIDVEKYSAEAMATAYEALYQKIK